MPIYYYVSDWPGLDFGHMYFSHSDCQFFSSVFISSCIEMVKFDGIWMGNKFNYVSGFLNVKLYRGAIISVLPEFLWISRVIILNLIGWPFGSICCETMLLLRSIWQAQLQNKWHTTAHLLVYMYRFYFGKFVNQKIFTCKSVGLPINLNVTV